MQLNDINISIGKEKIRTGVIFLFGFVTGGVSLTLITKSKITKQAEVKANKHIEATQDLTLESIKRADEALIKLAERTKKLEATVDEYELDRRSMKMEVK